MLSTSILSLSLAPPLSLSLSRWFPPFLPNRPGGDALSLSTPHPTRIPSNFSRIYQTTLSPVCTTAVEETVETSKLEQEFIEIGYICSVHGLQGEVRVKPNTDFPELRFSKPGRRWLRHQVLGKEKVQEVELIKGRGQQEQKTWIVKFKEFDTVDKARQLIGSTMLVTEEDKPELEEGMFYSRDLVGMRVILKDTAELVGTVANVFNTGASDILQVMRHPSTSGSEAVDSGPLVWVPFVKAIVPIVDMNRREMFITPPKGLLELNKRSSDRSKKERRALEWKERKKYQKRLIAAKKKLCEMEQQHVFHGFRHGEKAQVSLLSDQILSVNSKLLRQALQNIKVTSQRWNLQEFIGPSLINYSSRLKIPAEQSSNSEKGEKVNAISNLKEKGRLLLSKGKVAIVLHVNGFQGKASVDDEAGDSRSMLDAIFNGPRSYLKMGDRASVPLIMVCPAQELQSLQNTFASHDHMGFDYQKVWFLEQEKLPVVSTSTEEQNKHLILMKSPWEILQAPVGSGGVISLLSSENFVKNLAEIGVEYFKVCSTNQDHTYGENLIGLVSSCEAKLGFQISKDMSYNDDSFNMVFSIDFMKRVTKSTKGLHFHAVPKSHAHVEKVNKEWVDIMPSSPNSYELQCSIYSCLSACPSDKICVMELTG